MMQNHQHRVLSAPLIALGLKKSNGAVAVQAERRTGALLVLFL